MYMCIKDDIKEWIKTWYFFKISIIEHLWMSEIWPIFCTIKFKYWSSVLENLTILLRHIVVVFWDLLQLLVAVYLLFNMKIYENINSCAFLLLYCMLKKSWSKENDENTMVLILDGNLLHVAHAWKKVGKNARFVTALDVIKCLEQVE